MNEVNPPAALSVQARRPLTASGWQHALSMLLLAQLWLLFCYRDTLVGMVGIWTRSETFTHGFLVLPISLWLIWRSRDQLRPLTPRPGWLALPLLAGAGFVWLLGALASTNVLAQFGLVFSLILTVPALLGWQIARQITFPLFFLLFAVPFGEFVIPTLMTWTADVAVLGIRFSGVPVYREGLEFVIPSGNWSVVEACSGVRYLIASLMVGTLFAYLNYYSLKRRLIFILVASLVPIAANWVRAYSIVMIGHLSGNTLAVGVDHLIYGWVFFGVVILAMFSIGARWQEHTAPAGLTPPNPAASSHRGRPPLWPVAVVLLGLITVWPVWQWSIEHKQPPPLGDLAVLDGTGPWQASGQLFTGWQPSMETPSVQRTVVYEHGKQMVGLYVAYYRQQDDNHKAISSRNVLVRLDELNWKQLNHRAHSVDLPDQVLSVQQAELRNRYGDRLLVWQWYWVNGRWTDSPRWARAYTALAQLAGQGDDTAVVMLYGREDKDYPAPPAMQSFLAASMPALASRLQQVRGMP
ncbi:exosortase A [Chitinimonas sp. BJB300]|uniref:exosortase A n=1 Tax=Chitinimonas sp. BJB300 TaxID=1559339 RepID=UPI000C0FB6A2|nr:exosortase A [Chitinimonas sp. BJB300]PHV12118.1 exosortase A [Chitinimonas sp. BJB300]TSJ89054.1 exosortase A [Chitinimonas sp. BJB300]